MLSFGNMAQQVERINVVSKSTPAAGTSLFAARQMKPFFLSISRSFWLWTHQG
jgi:hypothetical protein